MVLGRAELTGRCLVGSVVRHQKSAPRRYLAAVSQYPRLQLCNVLRYSDSHSIVVTAIGVQIESVLEKERRLRRQLSRAFPRHRGCAPSARPSSQEPSKRDSVAGRSFPSAHVVKLERLGAEEAQGRELFLAGS